MNEGPEEGPVRQCKLINNMGEGGGGVSHLRGCDLKIAIKVK